MLCFRTRNLFRNVCLNSTWKFILDVLCCLCRSRWLAVKFWTVSFFGKLATWNDSQCRPNANEFKLWAAVGSHKEIIILHRFTIQLGSPSALYRLHKVLNWTPQAAMWTLGNQEYRRSGENGSKLAVHGDCAIYHQLVICPLLPDVDSSCYKTVRPLFCGFEWKSWFRTRILYRTSHVRQLDVLASSGLPRAEAREGVSISCSLRKPPQNAIVIKSREDGLSEYRWSTVDTHTIPHDIPWTGSISLINLIFHFILVSGASRLWQNFSRRKSWSLVAAPLVQAVSNSIMHLR